MAEVETTEEISEPEEIEETPDVAAQLQESQSTIASLRAMLASLAPDVDVDAELDNVAFKRDGSPVYIGEVKELQAEAKTETKAKPPARTRPAETRGAPGKVSASSMDDKGLMAAVSQERNEAVHGHLGVSQWHLQTGEWLETWSRSTTIELRQKSIMLTLLSTSREPTLG